MKPLRFLFITLFTFSFLNSSYGQLFTGGYMYFNNSNSESELNNNLSGKSASCTFTFSPTIGKFISEKLAIGFDLNVSINRTKSGINDETINKSISYGGNPYIRYYALKWNKFSVFTEAYLGLDFSRSRYTFLNSTADGPKHTRIFIGAYPGLSYDISERFSLQSSLNFLNIGYSYVTIKDDSSIEKESNFNFSTGLDNILSIGSMTIGAIYKF
jgi:outer membrane protein